MVQNNKTRILDIIYQEVLSNNLSANNIDKIIEFLESVLKDEEFICNKDNCFILLNILLILRLNRMTTTKLVLLIQEIEAKILRLSAQEYWKTLTANEDEQECSCCEDSKNICNVSNNEGYFFKNEIFEIPYYIEETESIKLPEPGKIMDLNYKLYDDANGKMYYMKVAIDHTGKVLQIIDDFEVLEMYQEDQNYKDLYDGILAEILNMTEET